MNRFAGPHLGIVATVFTVLFLAGLYPVTMFGGMPFFPGPYESPGTIQAFFQARPGAVVACAFFHFGASIPLGIFTATVVSQLRFLGVRAAGTYIALFGGFVTSLHIAASALISLGDGASRNCARHYSSSGVVLHTIRVWRTGFLSPDGAFVCRSFDSRGS
jgi:hypothetical protein